MWSDDQGRYDERNRHADRRGDERGGRETYGDEGARRSEIDRAGRRAQPWRPGDEELQGGRSAASGRDAWGDDARGRGARSPERGGEWQRSYDDRGEGSARWDARDARDARGFGGYGGSQGSGMYGRQSGFAPSDRDAGLWGDIRHRDAYGGYGAGGRAYEDRDARDRDDPYGREQGQRSFLASQGQWGSGWAASHGQNGEGWAEGQRAYEGGRDERGRGEYGDMRTQHGGSPSRGEHTGRGPKGWKRSDDRIRDDVSEQLSRHPDIDASEIEVEVHEGEVILSGTVDDRRVKRMAEDVAEQVYGVHEVQNQLRVLRASDRGQHDAYARDREISRTTDREGATGSAMQAGATQEARTRGGRSAVGTQGGGTGSTSASGTPPGTSTTP